MFQNTRELSADKLKEYAGKLGLDVARWEKDMNAPETQSQVDKEMQEARAADVQGTPTIFVGGKRLQNRSADGFKQMIDAALKEKGDKRRGSGFGRRGLVVRAHACRPEARACGYWHSGVTLSPVLPLPDRHRMTSVSWSAFPSMLLPSMKFLIGTAIQLDTAVTSLVDTVVQHLVDRDVVQVGVIELDTVAGVPGHQIHRDEVLFGSRIDEFDAVVTIVPGRVHDDGAVLDARARADAISGVLEHEVLAHLVFPAPVKLDTFIVPRHAVAVRRRRTSST